MRVRARVAHVARLAEACSRSSKLTRTVQGAALFKHAITYPCHTRRSNTFNNARSECASSLAAKSRLLQQLHTRSPRRAPAAHEHQQLTIHQAAFVQ
jgi:hypothetical protein